MRQFPADYEERWVAKDGEELVIRMVRPEDKELFVAGLKLLSPVSIYNRFMVIKSEFSSAELRYLTEVDGENHVAMVVLSENTKCGGLIGVGRSIVLEGSDGVADIGLIVADEWQGLGVGKALMRRLAYAARERGVSTWVGEMFSSNTAMFHLVDTFVIPARWELEGIVARFEMDLTRLPEKF